MSTEHETEQTSYNLQEPGVFPTQKANRNVPHKKGGKSPKVKSLVSGKLWKKNKIYCLHSLNYM